MIRQVLNFRNSEFKRNFALVFSGSSASVIISLIFAPWLARLYPPREFGIFGVILAIGTIIGAVSSLRYSHAIQVTDSQENAEQIMIHSRYIVVLTSFAAFLFLFCFYSFNLQILESYDMGYAIFFVAAIVLLIGLMEVYSVWLNRNKSFRSISINRVLLSLVTVIISLAWAYLVDRSFKGLLSGFLLGHITAILFLHIESKRFRKTNGNWQQFKTQLAEFKEFPLFELPATLANNLTSQLPTLLLGRFAGAIVVGHYNMGNRLLGMPSALISSAMGEVFRQRAAEDYHTKGNCRPILVKTFFVLASIGLFPLIIVLLFGPWLFAFVLGEEWRTAGEYSRILAILVFFRFSISPLTYIFYIAKKQKQNLVGQLLLVFCSAMPFIIGFKYLESVETSLLLYSLSYSLIYLLYYVFAYRYARLETAKS